MLIAIFDADANFIYVNVGAQGSNNDASVLKQTNFYKEENRLNLPNPEPIVPNSESLPFFFHRRWWIWYRKTFNETIWWHVGF